ncbi:12949_t:CDS:2 [Entrophospora sp. SA101]|nr:12949_t:CDS:2 [Entrophospora sp. SA101]CAJ0834348.1 14271_t:CDS:2 [Entrophospora sp. SA101]CAJ0868025.1 9732_t:CDS:2 [Entrophospora sp. SA101]CAJ0925912.1 21561_t:CDS:2 [Entrophospora sp. SA101]
MEDDNDELSALEDDPKPVKKKRSTQSKSSTPNKKKDDSVMNLKTILNHQRRKSSRQSKSSHTKRKNDEDIIGADELEDDSKSLIKKGDELSDPKPLTKKRSRETKSSIPKKKNDIIDSGELSGLKDDPKPSMEKRSQKMMINPELAGCEDTKSQIRELKEILVELGWKNRRDLEAELKSMDIDNIITNNVKESRKTRAYIGIFNPTG